MDDFDQYSLTGCLIDPEYSEAPQLRSLGGTDPAQSVGSSALGRTLPPRVDLRKYCSPVEDQGRTNSCVANAVVGALEILQRKQGHSSQDLSRLFSYYNARLFHGQKPEDKGTYVHFAMASLVAQGICEARMWPFSSTVINDPPTQACYQNAQHYRGVEFAEIQKGTPLTHIIAQEIPVVIAVRLPRQAYLSAHQTDLMALPEGDGMPHQHGNHAMVVVGYDLEQKTYLVRNSWGTRFAKDGYFHMPMSIFDHASLAGQQWAIGALNGAPGLELLGQSVQQSVDGMVAAAVSPQVQDMSKFASEVAKDMGSRLETAKQGFRSRLRGD
ncbi:MAG: C1 family peptidase [Pseudomonadota bacterium]